MTPKYMDEIRYSYLVGSFRRPLTDGYQVETPETSFEASVQSLFLEGQRHLHHEEFNLALGSFRELMALILRTVDPDMPVDPNSLPWLQFPTDLGLIDVLCARSAETLKVASVVDYAFPATVVSQAREVPQVVGDAISDAARAGIEVTSFHAGVARQVQVALAAAAQQDWPNALASYEAAAALVPDAESLVKGSLLHDMAVLAEKAGDPGAAGRLGTDSVTQFGASGRLDLQATALDTATGILRRAGDTDGAARFAAQADEIRGNNNVNPVFVPGASLSHAAVPFGGIGIGRLSVADRAIAGAGASHIGIGARAVPAGLDIGRIGELVRAQPVLEAGLEAAGEGGAAALRKVSVSVDAPSLIGLGYMDEPSVADTVVKTFTAKGSAAMASIVLDNNAASNAKTFLADIATTVDVGLLTGYFFHPVQLIAYLPHMYFFVIPMSIGDCLAGMGSLDAAASQYQSVLPYPFINKKLEIVRVWTRLAQVFVDAGDRAYRDARDDVAQFAAARASYENIVRLDKTLSAASPLYADAQFASIRDRVAAFLAAPDPLAVDENPAITSIVLTALSRIAQIEQGLNFFGSGPDYLPPFSFEYLQNTARYFAQQASQIEQRYVQFKSQAENEQLRRDQLDQQAEVARQSVVLEERGVAEAQAGVGVALASQAYAQRQVDNAIAARQDFQNSRWELLELTEAEAWASASSVDRDDQVKLTWTGNYYNSDHKRRNQVLQDLAYQRARLSQDLEENKLDREVASAQAYLGVTQAQIGQAQARVDVAEQRVVVAQLQQAFAEQNRDFLDMREFSSQLWYDLAAQARRISRRYLDMATEMAFLMERAYNAETERGLHVIRFDYEHTTSGDLMGGDILAADIDSFTFDLVTTTKTKKLPVKVSISIADSYPMQFAQLKNAGSCLFETALEDFDRRYPGLYLAKVRNVELIFVGVTEATSIAGTLRNIGVSRFRRSDGTVVERLYPADVMALSQYDMRQDALAFRVSPNELRLFENNGIATSWQLDMPLSANDFSFDDILDVYFVLYFDGFYDPVLEAATKAALPATGQASRAFSMRMSFPDELFYLRNQGEAELTFDDTFFPRNQLQTTRTTTTLKVTGSPLATQNLTLELGSVALGGAPLTLTTNADGEVLDGPGSPLAQLDGRPMIDELAITIRAADNPHLVQNGALDLSGIEDVLLFNEYDFTYR